MKGFLLFPDRKGLRESHREALEIYRGSLKWILNPILNSFESGGEEDEKKF